MKFKVMLAKKFANHKHKITNNFTITKKLDGVRIIIIKENNIAKVFSRTGKECKGLNEIVNEINLCEENDIVLDGELLAITNNSLSTQQQFTETIKRSQNKSENKTGLIFNIFDMISLKEFENGTSKLNHINRKSLLHEWFNKYKFKHNIIVKDLYIGNDINMINIWIDIASNQNWEGLMINLDKPYVCKRTDSLLKIKKMQTIDLKITDIIIGKGKYSTVMGKCIVKYKGNNVGVGSGWTDELRTKMYNNKNDYIGKIIEIQYFEVSKDSKTNLESLRFPVFKRFRNDKTKESYN